MGLKRDKQENEGRVELAQISRERVFATLAEIDEQIFGSAPPEELAAAIAEEIAREDAAVPEDGSSSEAEIAKSSSGSDLHSQYSPDLHSQHSSSR